MRKLARYLHQMRLIDATVILMVAIPTVTDWAPARQGLDRPAWDRVLTVSRARLTASARSRATAAAAARDLALIQVLGGAGLRSGVVGKNRVISRKRRRRGRLRTPVFARRGCESFRSGIVGWDTRAALRRPGSGDPLDFGEHLSGGQHRHADVLHLAAAHVIQA